MTIFTTASRIFTLPPASDWLDEVARGLVAATDAKSNPEALADALIFTPNQRAAREFALALYRATDNTLLTPEIRTLGDIEEEEGLAAFGPDALDLPPSIPPAERRGALARLIQHWRTLEGGEPLPPSALLSAADELCTLIDQAWMVGGVDWKKLDDLADELSPQLAEHWRSSAGFLDIVMRAWPKHLKELGYSDVQVRRLGAAEALSRRWASKPPAHPVVVIGSTGAGAATRILMQAVLGLPKGVIVLPGLDPDPAGDDWDAIAAAASHPQYVLHATLQWLAVKPEAVRAWPADAETPAAIARRRLLNQALAPAVKTSDWTQRLAALSQPDPPDVFVTAALAGLCLVEAEDENEEALAAALLLRETLETPNKTAALVTPEASLARRVAAILERWGIDIAPSSGAPLSRSPTGSLLIILTRWIFDPGDPVLLLALLKHEHMRVSRDADDLHRLTTRIDRDTLRGPRKHRTLEDLACRLENPPRTEQEIKDGKGPRPDPEGARLIRDLDALVLDHVPALDNTTFDGAIISDAIARLAENLATSPTQQGARIWGGKAGAMSARYVLQLSQLAKSLAGVEAHDFPDFAAAVIRNMTSPPDAPEHPRIAIWGPLEARLQRRDRVILASLNEGSWPRAAAADAFLNRTLRARIGLPDPDERIGLSAHDFAQLSNAPEVILLRARRVDDKPAVASRWLWRLRTLAAGGLGGRDKAEAMLRPAADCDPLAWAASLRASGVVDSARPPCPKPPVKDRALLKFSPSRAVTLIRDPYADYARRILRLDPLRRAGEDIDARERGTAVHAAVEAFENSGKTLSLSTLIIDELTKAGAEPDLIALELPLWDRAAKAYLRWSEARAPDVKAHALEERAEIEIETTIGIVKLEAKADRIELLRDGTLAIIDFKTGAPKRAPQVETGLEPQLPLEAAIAVRAQFGDLPKAETSQLIYFRLSLSARTSDNDNGQPLKFKNTTTQALAVAAAEGLKSLIEQYGDADQPYLSKPRVEFIWSVSDYDRLARRAEWSATEGGDA